MTEEGIRTQPEESKQELNRFIVSIVLSFLGIVLLTILISFIPNKATSFSSEELLPIDGSNFFYEWAYRLTDINPPYNYFLRAFVPSTGYHVFATIASVLMLLSFSGNFIQSKRRTKQLIFINWGLAAIPIIAFIVKLSLIASIARFSVRDSVLNVALTLGFYALIYLPLQILLLIEKKTLYEFFGFVRKDQSINKKDLTARRVNAGFTIAIYLSAILLLIKPLFYVVVSDYKINPLLIGIITALLGVWFIVNMIIILSKHIPDIRKAFFGLLIGMIIVVITWIIVASINSRVMYDFPAANQFTLKFPQTLIVTLFTISFILLMSIPIGFFASNKKHIAAVASIPGVLIFVYFIILIVNAFVYACTPGVKIYMIFQSLLYFGLFYAGAFWGRFLGKKVFREKLEFVNSIDLQEPVSTLTTKKSGVTEL